MRATRIALALLATMSVVSMSQVGIAKPAEAAPTGPAISWSYSAEANAYWRPPSPTSSPGNDGPLLAWTQYAGAKDLTCPEGDPAYACQGDPGAKILGIYCGDFPGPTGLPTFAWIRWERTPNPDGTMGLWIGEEADCDEPGPDDVVTMDEIRTQMLLTADVLQELPEPTPAIEPAPRGLVNLPVIVSTDYPNPDDPIISAFVVPGSDPVRLEIPIVINGGRFPFTGLITAWLDDYTWTFKDGKGDVVKTISGRGPGTPYTRSVDPKANPGYYISHTYREAGVGNMVQLNANWVGTVRVPGVGVDEPMNPEPIQGNSLPFEVVEAKSVLGN